MNEIWEWISGYEGEYAISTLGRVWSEHSKRLLSLTPNYAGYLVVDLSKNGTSAQFRVHRLVAGAFLPNPNALPQVNHINEKRNDNRVDNLEWCTSKHNNNHGNHNKKISNSHREKCLDGYRIKVKKPDDIGWVRYKSIRQACEATGGCRKSICNRCRNIGSNVVRVGDYIYWLHPGSSLYCGASLRKER